MTVEIGEGNQVGLYIPKGVAHGFCALKDSIMTYLVDEYYDGGDELGIAWNDPAVGIDWGVSAPNVSGRDAGNSPVAKIAPEIRPR